MRCSQILSYCSELGWVGGSQNVSLSHLHCANHDLRFNNILCYSSTGTFESKDIPQWALVFCLWILTIQMLVFGLHAIYVCLCDTMKGMGVFPLSIMAAFEQPVLS